MSEQDSPKVSELQRIVTAEAGDTLDTIARRFYGDAEFALPLSRFNGMARSAILTVGTKIKVPPKSTLLGQKRAQRVTRQLPNLGALPTDLPLPTSPGTLAPITADATPPWWMNQKIWIAAGAGAILAYLLFAKNSPLKL